MAINFQDLDTIHYCRLLLNKDGKSALVLGYKIQLTASEYLILDVLNKCEAYVSKSELESKYGLTYSSIAVHIANINRKAHPITGRSLIEGNGHGEYRISDTM